MAIDPITAGLNLGKALLERFVADPDERVKAESKLLEMAVTGELAQFTAAANIVTEEAKSDHWLTSAWRPMVMLTFTALVVAHWFGWTADNITDQVTEKLLSIVQLGLGGYVIGRSVEKTARIASDAAMKWGK